MIITGLDGKQYKLSFNRTRKNITCSGLHSLAYDYLKKAFPFDLIYEEVLLPGTKVLGRTKNLYADFLIPTRHIMIEVQGEQHYKYTGFFHRTLVDFGRSKQRDDDKAKWCDINGFRLLELKYDESDEWEQRISEYKCS